MTDRFGRGRNRIMSFVLAAALMCLTACGPLFDTHETAEEISGFKIYYVNSAETALGEEPYLLTSDKADPVAVIDELILMLSTTPDNPSLLAPITGKMNLKGYNLSDRILTMDYAESYSSIDDITEILDRAAVVRTLSQVDGVDYVAFTIEGKPLMKPENIAVGNMTADTFIYNAGNEINTYEKVTLTLYFANEAGDGLVTVYRTVVYNSNISMERLSVEQLIKGPNMETVYPTINPATGIDSVSVRDGICYVDLSSEFLTETYEVSAETAIYSLVNSLVDYPEVNKVQISIDGKTDVKFMDSIDLSKPLERNLEIIKN
ncbi:GerMN domain-containing protein [Butyrivibrio sp. MC2013]|uniref:GerMN domain-containing protein n=1 Tax=Butyrivibrio sp. MC2013 TaxID=1280686 RepID=UPI00040AE2F8|nr:GerMN domain-containing protein [Butyrivibrio sp. MC2013]